MSDTSPGHAVTADAAHAEAITEALGAIADSVEPSELDASYLVPSVFDASVAPAVTAAVRDAADRDGARP